MEHLPYPRSPAVPVQEVKYVCSTPYDQLDFLGYPRRARWPEADAIAKADMTIHLDFGRGVSNSGLEDFCQRWLFFGMLHEILGPLYRQADFLRMSDSVWRLDTSLLPQLLQEWMDQTRTWDVETRSEASARLQKCLEVCTVVLSSLWTKYPAGVNLAILLSISAVWEVISASIKVAFDLGVEFLASAPWAFVEVKSKNLFMERMVESGWCVVDTSMAIRRSMSISEGNFLSALSPPYSSVSHKACRNRVCVHAEIKRNRMPGHWHDACNCSLIGACPNQLNNALRSGAFPLLRIIGNAIDEVEIEVVPFTDNGPFVALSHVWSHGMGNPNAQKLPRCQLLRLQTLIASFCFLKRWGTEEPEQRSLLLWCDTLCVPPDDPNADHESRDLRENAMGKMRKVYEAAAYVLILDNTLEPFALKKIGHLEAAGRLLLSPWMRRLWTYQEVFLANIPVVHFADGLVDMRILWQAIIDLRLGGSAHQQISASFDVSLARLSARWLSGRPFCEMLPSLNTELAHRRLSVASDEPICLSNILSLDTREILATRDRDKMVVFWRLLATVPSSIRRSIVFNLSSRLDVPGFRWAPKTMLESDDTKLAAVLAFAHDPALCATLTPQGLLVEFPAWKVRAASLPQGLGDSVCNPFTFDYIHKRNEHSRVLIRGLGGEWWTVQAGERWLGKEGNGLSHVFETKEQLVVVKEPGQNNASLGLVGSISSPAGGASAIVTTRSIVVLGKEPELEQRLWDAAYAKANDLIRSNKRPQLFHVLLRKWLSRLVQARPWLGLLDGVLLWPGEALNFCSNEDDACSQDSRDSLSIIQQCSNSPDRNIDFALRVLQLYLGRYSRVEEDLPDDTVWCID